MVTDDEEERDNVIQSRWREGTIKTIGQSSWSRKRTDVYRLSSTKENITHVIHPLTMCIENLEGGPFARSVWALHRATKATAPTAYWNAGLLTVLQIQFEKLQAFSELFYWTQSLLLTSDNCRLLLKMLSFSIRCYFDGNCGIRQMARTSFFLFFFYLSSITSTHKLYKLSSRNTDW